jgi:Ca-activated chloride channel family protein
MQFEYPAAFFLLLALPVALLVKRRGEAAAIAFPGILNFQSARQGLRQRCLRYLPWLRMAALAMLVFAIAGPRLPPGRSRRVSEGAAIEIVVDRSASMLTSDMSYSGVAMSRLDAVKRITREFIFGDGGELEGRPKDLIGLIGFAASPIPLCPLMLSHDVLRSAIEKLQAAESLRDDGTAIGDALTVAAARLHETALSANPPLTAKLIVLITDGENNMGARTPLQAAQQAREWGVRICAITLRPDARDVKYERQISNEMEAVAISTHGIARMARDGSALRSIYQEIDRMGTGQLEQVQSNNVDLAFVGALVAAFFLMALEVALRETWLRKVPA